MTDKRTLPRSRYLNFSNEEDENLIAIVETHRALYDICEKDHRDLVVRNNMWIDVSRKMNRSVTDCKKRWRSMKDTYYRHKRTKMQSNWILFSKLEFLDNAGRNYEASNEESSDKMDECSVGKEFDNHPPIKGEALIDIDENMVPYDSDLASESKLQTDDFPKFDLTTMRERMVDNIENDPIFMFFHSIALTVKKLPLELIVDARVKICEIVGELELKAKKQKENEELTFRVKEEDIDEEFDAC